MVETAKSTTNNDVAIRIEKDSPNNNFETASGEDCSRLQSDYEQELVSKAMVVVTGVFKG